MRSLAMKTCPKNPPVFLGEVGYHDIPLILRSAFCLILASKEDASPTVIKEALAVGTPVVSNEIGDVAEFVDNGRSGFVVEKEMDEYYKAILKLNDLNLTRDTVYQYSINKLERCTPSSIASHYIELYQS